MKFKPGPDSRRGKGGKRAGAGRKSKKTKEIKEEAAALAKEYIDKRVKQVMDSYFKLINGRIVKHYDKTGVLIDEEEVIDSAAVRHAVDTLVPKRAPEDSAGNAMPGYYNIIPPE